MSLDKDELKKLSPEARIKKLKQLEEDTKKELEEASELIKRTKAEINESHIPDIEVPKLKPIDISAMFEPGEGLEGTIKQQAPLEEEEETKVLYSAPSIPSENMSVYVPDEHDWVEVEHVAKFDDFVKYRSASKRGDELTGSRSVLDNIKKYSGQG